LEAATCHIMPVIVRSAYEEIRALLREARIQTSKHYDLIPSFSAFQKSSRNNRNVAFPIMTLPLGPGMKEEDVQLIYEIIHNRE